MLGLQQLCSTQAAKQPVMWYQPVGLDRDLGTSLHAPAALGDATTPTSTAPTPTAAASTAAIPATAAAAEAYDPRSPCQPMHAVWIAYFRPVRYLEGNQPAYAEFASGVANRCMIA